LPLNNIDATQSMGDEFEKLAVLMLNLQGRWTIQPGPYFRDR